MNHPLCGPPVLVELGEGCRRKDAAAHRQARAYKALQIVLTPAMQQHQLTEGQMATFLASAPDLAQRLALWQAGDGP
jgi:hypothetical protein